MTGTAYAATSEQGGGVTMAGAGGNDRVAYGRELKVAGQVASSPGSGVRLEHAPAGEDWRPVAETTSNGDGSYSFAVRAERSGAYRAVSASGVSEQRRVTVVARLASRASRHQRLGSNVRVRGLLRPRRSGRMVRLQLAVGKRWKTVDRARTNAGGRYSTSWSPERPGAYRLRVKFGGDRLNGAVSRTLRGRANVYRAGLASWYGPGFYGRRTACGQTITAGIMGVANKSLPCGTRVTFRYRGRSVTVPVIDRGPYAGAREWDLTAATKERLGFGSTGTVWTTK